MFQKRQCHRGFFRRDILDPLPGQLSNTNQATASSRARTKYDHVQEIYLVATGDENKRKLIFLIRSFKATLQ
jgi:hypothetical protein